MEGCVRCQALCKQYSIFHSWPLDGQKLCHECITEIYAYANPQPKDRQNLVFMYMTRIRRRWLVLIQCLHDHQIKVPREIMNMILEKAYQNPRNLFR